MDLIDSNQRIFLVVRKTLWPRYGGASFLWRCDDRPGQGFTLSDPTRALFAQKPRFQARRLHPLVAPRSELAEGVRLLTWTARAAPPRAGLFHHTRSLHSTTPVKDFAPSGHSHAAFGRP